MNLILFFTGNPPIPTVYDDFFMHLKKQLGESDLHELPLYTTKTELEDMSLEVLFKLNGEDALNLIQSKNYQKIFLIGHSIGCSAILSQYNLLSPYVYQYYFIQPYVLPSKGNLVFLQTIENHLVSYFLFFSVGLISKVKPIYRLGIKKFTDNSEKTPIIANELNLKFIQRLLRVLKTYLPFFKNNNLRQALNKIPLEKQFSFFSPGDFWSNDENKSFFKENHSLLNVNHDFCLSKEQSIQVAKNISEKIISQH